MRTLLLTIGFWTLLTVAIAPAVTGLCPVWERLLGRSHEEEAPAQWLLPGAWPTRESASREPGEY